MQTDTCRSAAASESIMEQIWKERMLKEGFLLIIHACIFDVRCECVMGAVSASVHSLFSRL